MTNTITISKATARAAWKTLTQVINDHTSVDSDLLADTVREYLDAEAELSDAIWPNSREDDVVTAAKTWLATLDNQD